MQDEIKNLPADTIPPTEEEKDLLKWLYPIKQQQKDEIRTPANKKSSSFKNLFILGLVFLLFQFPILKIITVKFVPLFHNDILFVFFKTLVFLIIIYILSYFMQKSG